MLKVIATGKGGVGKTTTISNLATMFAREGKNVMVLDTDPSMNLAMTLGLPYLETATITEHKNEINDQLDEDPIFVSKHLITEYSTLNKDGVRIMVMGAIPDEGNGCLCSAVSIMKVLLSYLDSDYSSEVYDVIFVDSQAGPEILGRGLAKDFDCNLVMTEPTPKSAEVSRQVVNLSRNLGIENNLIVINKSESEEDRVRVAEKIGVSAEDSFRIPFDHKVMESDWENEILYDSFPDCDAMKSITTIKNRLEALGE
jgi:CO dehydrogenase maturation factor